MSAIPPYVALAGRLSPALTLALAMLGAAASTAACGQSTFPSFTGTNGKDANALDQGESDAGAAGGGGFTPSGTGGGSSSGGGAGPGPSGTGGRAAGTGGTSSGGRSGGTGGATPGTGGVSPSGGAGGGVAGCQVNATQCTMNALQTCGTDRQWGMAVPCGPRQTCSGAVGAAKCTCNADPVCKGGGKTCASMTMLATCMQDAQSCYYAASTSTCTMGTCGGAGGSAACSCACTVGATECVSSTSLGTCATGPNSCNVQSIATCGGGLVCERVAPASCADPSWAEWPVPPTTSPTGYTDNGDGTITDSVTGLMWEKTGPTTWMMYPAAVTYCGTMATTGGHRDWRLPSTIELMSIVDYGRSDPSINPIFIGTTSTYYWSSTLYVGTSLVWSVNFYDGAVKGIDMTSLVGVRCVR
jgi:hypothetical protein